MKTCPDCGKQNRDFQDNCSKCGARLKNNGYSAPKKSRQLSSNCKFSVVLFILAWIELLGGIIYAIRFMRIWRWSPEPTLIALAFGFFSFISFYATGIGLNYLYKTSSYLNILTSLNIKIHNSLVELKESQETKE